MHIILWRFNVRMHCKKTCRQSRTVEDCQQLCANPKAIGSILIRANSFFLVWFWPVSCDSLSFPSAMMSTARLWVEIWRWRAAPTPIKLTLCYRKACPLFPRQLRRTNHTATARASGIFFQRLFLYIYPQFCSAQFKKKERKLSSIPTFCLIFVVRRGHWFIGTRLPISFETSSKELFEPAVFRSRPKLLKPDLRTSLSRFQIQSKEKICSDITTPCHTSTIRNSRSLRYFATPRMVLSNTKYGKA